MNKGKGQVSGQIFVYIFALIVASATLLMGYNYLQKLTDEGKKADIAMFQKNLASDIKSAQGYGTELKSKRYSSIPPQYKELCFAELEGITSSDAARIDKTTIKNSVTSKARKNVFLWPQSGESFFYVENIAVQNKYACFKALKGVVKVNMTGCGDRTIISSIPSDTATVCT